MADRSAFLEHTVRGDSQRPWAGRAPATYRWKRGDIAATVAYARYRIGVILAPPPSLESLAKQRGYEAAAGQNQAVFTRMDDVSLLGFADFDHAHPSDPPMFEPLDPVPEELLRRLERRLAPMSLRA